MSSAEHITWPIVADTIDRVVLVSVGLLIFGITATMIPYIYISGSKVRGDFSSISAEVNCSAMERDFDIKNLYGM